MGISATAPPIAALLMRSRHAGLTSRDGGCRDGWGIHGRGTDADVRSLCQELRDEALCLRDPLHFQCNGIDRARQLVVANLGNDRRNLDAVTKCASYRAPCAKVTSEPGANHADEKRHAARGGQYYRVPLA